MQFAKNESRDLNALTRQDVMELQHLLLTCGYSIGVPDGLIGLKTISGFNQFKIDASQGSPGKIGAGSYALLKKEAAHRKAGKYPEEQATRVQSNSSPNKGKCTLVKFPKGEVCLEDFVVKGGEHFTWYEATKNGDPERFPDSVEAQTRMEWAITRLEKVRELLGVPIVITSFYRPYVVNKRVGGASSSRHLFGDGIDWYAVGMPIEKAWEVLEKSELYANDGRAMSKRGRFIHCDLRGYSSVWSYS